MSDERSVKLEGDLLKDGLIVAGTIDEILVDNLLTLGQTLSVEEKKVRLTELFWEKECKEIQEYFDKELKPGVSAIKDRRPFNHLYVHYHNKPQETPVFRSKGAKGKYVVIIVIQEGQGLPKVCKGSHLIEDDEKLPAADEAVKIPQSKGLAIVYDGNIGIVDPPVEVDDKGALAIYLVY